ncbi:tetratricopeptide repeat-containing sensor histidine kinase [Pseudozobellia thermophila]|uniref:Tetratricopeptide repeat-containing protein n=1 Tax=Pseudozobellia thermophila TaxID=192903 RepID=A0A1M6MLU3_9FLAO|nr:tetratricopeptide repeat protein [Pseudozobellia thermophila]SHJ84356.1 Tetratricopeptide repeat-containing protein [Pseudozobellia thermophila]
MRFSWVPLIFLLPYFAFSQQRQIDSIQGLLADHVQNDSVRLALLNELAYLHYSIDPEEGLRVGDGALLLAKRLNDTVGLATAYSYKGHNYSALGRDTLALEMYGLARDLKRRNNDRAGEARLIYNMGLVYFNQADYRRANDCNQRAYDVFEKEKDSFLMAKMLNSIGINHMYLSQYPRSLEAYLKAKDIYEDLKLTGDLEYVNINSNIGLLYAHLEKFDWAGKYQKYALEGYKKQGFRVGEANALTNLGRLRTQKGMPEEAIGLYEQALAIMEEIHNERGQASALTNIGIAYVELKAYEKALPYFQRTQGIYEKLNNHNNLSIVHRNLGDCYFNLAVGGAKWANLDRAGKNYNLSLDYAEEVHNLSLQYNAFESLAELYRAKGDFERAYDNKARAVVLKDSFNSTDKKEEMARLEAQYQYEGEKTKLQADFEKKEMLAKAEVEKQRVTNKMVVFSSSVFLVALLVAFVMYKKRSDALAAKKLAEFNAQVAETELKALRSQMNPHFIFNALNSISDYMAKNDIAKAEAYLLKFAKLTRAILENSEKKWITLGEDLELMKIYMDIEAMRLNHPLNYSIEVDRQVDPGNTLVPPLLLQPFIENSIWHGISKKNGEGRVDVHVRAEGDFLVCCIDDDGVGRQKKIDMRKENHSMGLKITRNRLEIINRLKRRKGSFKVVDKQVGTLVEVKLPLELQF